MFGNAKQIIFKVTEGCNLRCSYCYVYGKDKARGKLISLENFTDVISRYFDETVHGKMLDNNTPDPSSAALDVIFHGGEPLTISKDIFAKYCKIVHQLARKYKKNVSIGLQTNAVLIDDDWIALFRKYKIHPGISSDGLLDTSNEERNAKQLLNTIMKLKRYELINGVLMVLHKSNYKNIIDEFDLLRNLDIKSVKMNRAVDVTTPNDSKVELNANELFEAYEKTFWYMMTHKDFYESSVVNWMTRYVESDSYGIENYKYGDHCYTRWCGAGNYLIEVEPDGTVNFCGRNNREDGRENISSPGKYNMNDVLELNLSFSALKFHEGKARSIVKNKCNLCHAQAICDGGCLAFATAKYGEPKIDSTTCGLNKKMHKLMVQNDSLVKEYVSKVLNKGGNFESNSHYYL